MKKIDRKVELLKKLQTEIDRRTQVKNEVISLISGGEHEKARELLESLDDQIAKDIIAELDRLDQEPEEETDEAEAEESDEPEKQFLRDFLLDVWAHLVIALQTKNIASFEWVIQRHAEKLLKLQKGRNENEKRSRH